MAEKPTPAPATPEETALIEEFVALAASREVDFASQTIAGCILMAAMQYATRHYDPIDVAKVLRDQADNLAADTFAIRAH